MTDVCSEMFCGTIGQKMEFVVLSLHFCLKYAAEKTTCFKFSQVGGNIEGLSEGTSEN